MGEASGVTLQRTGSASHGQQKLICTSKLEKYGFAISIIVGIGGLAVTGVGLAAYLGAFSNLSQVNAMILVGVGGGVFLIAGIVSSVKGYQLCRTSGNPSGIQVKTPGKSEEIKESLPVPEQLESGQSYFGKEALSRLLGDVDVEPKHKQGHIGILNALDPFDETDRKIKDMYIMVLMPKTVNGKPLTLNNLKLLLKEKGIKFEFDDKVCEKFGDISVKKSHWMLMRKELVPKSRGKNVEEQLKLVAKRHYDLPSIMEAAIGILLGRLSNKTKKANRVYQSKDPIFTRCKGTMSENPVIVGYSKKGLQIIFDEGNRMETGAGVVRRL